MCLLSISRVTRLEGIIFIYLNGESSEISVKCKNLRIIKLSPFNSIHRVSPKFPKKNMKSKSLLQSCRFSKYVDLINSRLSGATLHIRHVSLYIIFYVIIPDKGKAFPLQAWTGSWGSWRMRLQNF